ncbi:MAG: hypothetical protein ACO1PB_13785 [Ramlibacter sp.]
MVHRTSSAQRSSLPPAGRRWGRGAQSVVPYLAAAARSRPGAAEEPAEAAERISNPVFRQMEIRLVWRDD